MKSILYFVKSKEHPIRNEEKESITRKEEQAINCNKAKKKNWLQKIPAPLTKMRHEL